MWNFHCLCAVQCSFVVGSPSVASPSALSTQTTFIIVGVCAFLLICCFILFSIFYYKRVYLPNKAHYIFRESPLDVDLRESMRGSRSTPIAPSNSVVLRHGGGGPQTEMVDGDSPSACMRSFSRFDLRFLGFCLRLSAWLQVF